MSRSAHVVVDLGFGDAGKGAITDHLCRAHRAHTVVRFNGGAQAGHNVVTADGRHHTFAQFGAGTFAGARTWLSSHMVVHPTALLAEARWLERAGVSDPLATVTVSASARVITPFHQAATRLRERASGHGSCGVGVGAVMRDESEGRRVLRAGELSDVGALRDTLHAMQGEVRRSLGALLDGDPDERAVLCEPAVIDAWIDALEPWRARVSVADDGALGDVLARDGTVVFEGAQGVLLDEWYGTHPHTTWSTCTFENALALLASHRYAGTVRRLGVLRTYATRHGAGPLPTEDRALTDALSEPHNPHGPWQGAFRAGWSDRVLLRYALAACGGVDDLALTHLDRVRAGWRVCERYEASRDDRAWFTDDGAAARFERARDLDRQARFTAALTRATPFYEGVSGDVTEYVRGVERALGAPVAVRAWGPTEAERSGR